MAAILRHLALRVTVAPVCFPCTILPPPSSTVPSGVHLSACYAGQILEVGISLGAFPCCVTNNGTAGTVGGKLLGNQPLCLPCLYQTAWQERGLRPEVCNLTGRRSWCFWGKKMCELGYTVAHPCAGPTDSGSGMCPVLVSPAVHGPDTDGSWVRLGSRQKMAFQGLVTCFRESCLPHIWVRTTYVVAHPSPDPRAQSIDFAIL